jgi:hypothetical protein
MSVLTDKYVDARVDFGNGIPQPFVTFDTIRINMPEFI